MIRKSRGDTATSDAPDFEQSLAELEALIARLERGDLPLAESLTLFEQGVALTRQCHTRLAEAKQRVEILLQDGARPFDPEAADADE
ncbi:MAG TPA: exodeoxyribonuclease VII small subunit [Steroidobacteraceae bacterium]|nr:exodeoxyribonuclease VII small subunit [Steroidobacteraceae bacterium]